MFERIGLAALVEAADRPGLLLLDGLLDGLLLRDGLTRDGDRAGERAGDREGDLLLGFLDCSILLR
jgi:hypothetical protein